MLSPRTLPTRADSGTSEPEPIAPMLATPSDRLPAGRGWAFEFKWDGYRGVVHIKDRRARIDSRRLNDVTKRFPQVAEGAAKVRERHVVLDGEIVALDPENRPSFGLLQQHLRVPGAGPRLAEQPPIVYFVFDVLARDGKSLLRKPYAERRAILHELALDETGWRVPSYEVDQGPAMLSVSENLRLEGLVAKRLGSVYQPGVRSKEWLKIKIRRRQEFVVGGWTEGEGSRHSAFGSLVLGYYDRRRSEARRGVPAPKLVHAGRVGTGFTDDTLKEILAELRRLSRKTSPFQVGDPGPDVHYVAPKLVAEVSFTEWTHLGILRQTSFHGLRTDKDPAEVIKEPVVGQNQEET